MALSPSAPPSVLQPPTSRPIVQATAPERYRIQFTVGQASHDKLRRLQALLRREIPDGDPATICDRAWTLLLEKVEKAKIAAVDTSPFRAIRFATDKVDKSARRTRHIPRAVKRAVWQRDGGQCAFVSANRRCEERTFLEFHHIRPYAKQGPATIANISMRCRRHNQYEAQLIFGPLGASVVRDAPAEVLNSPGCHGLTQSGTGASVDAVTRTVRGHRHTPGPPMVAH
jgi:hypothetical protein